jgi:hypothetical protein
LLNELVKPLSDRNAGSTRRVVGGFARFWTEASEVPRTAGFIARAKPLQEGTRKSPCFEPRRTQKIQGRDLLTSMPTFPDYRKQAVNGRSARCCIEAGRLERCHFTVVAVV